MRSLWSILILTILVTSPAFAASPDGIGPWADEVISFSQGNNKDGSPVLAVRSNPQAALGEAENDTVDSHFSSLGFGGSLVLRFDNAFSNGVLVVESTNNPYPDEKARIEVSADGANWYTAGEITQDGSVTQPQQLTCAAYVRITDISNPDDFTDDTADGYDVDGIQVLESQACQIEEEVDPTPSPTPTVTPSTTDNTNQSDSNSSTNDNNNNDTNTNVCSSNKPGTPSLSVTRTSSTTAALSWNSVNDVTHYAISYGLSAGNYEYGVANVGNTTSFSVGGLAPNTNYFFVVRAINDCQPGDESNEVSIGTSGGQVLGISSETGGRGQVLGLSTESLAATGSIFEIIRLIGALTTGLVGFKIVSNVISDDKQTS